MYVCVCVCVCVRARARTHARVGSRIVVCINLYEIFLQEQFYMLLHGS